MFSSFTDPFYYFTETVNKILLSKSYIIFHHKNTKLLYRFNMRCQMIEAIHSYLQINKIRPG
jgi:hypothetical protein